jgi:NAD(P)-dependent dehydrogenase (short-subunit alcohol dehydrogenase family)
MMFADKAVLITGAGQGLGQATAAAFLAAGARVAINDLERRNVERAMQSLGGAAGLAAAPGDVASVAGCEAAVGAAVEAFGRLDVLVNNAGVFRSASISETDESLWDFIVDVILKGTFFCSRAALPELRRSRGAIVNIASENGLRGGVNVAAYSAAKAGVINLTRAQALELAPEVRANCICPGTIDTEMTRESARAAGDVEAALRRYAQASPLQRIATPGEVANAVLFLASPASSFVTGAVLSVDGGSMAGRR